MAMQKKVQMTAELYRADQLTTTEQDIEQVNQLIELGKRAMEERFFIIPRTLPQNLFGPSPLASFFGRALIAYTKADCALFNAGIFLGSLDKGWVTKEELTHTFAASDKSVHHHTRRCRVKRDL